jgi:hypothetical protein
LVPSRSVRLVCPTRLETDLEVHADRRTFTDCVASS